MNAFCFLLAHAHAQDALCVHHAKHVGRSADPPAPVLPCLTYCEPVHTWCAACYSLLDAHPGARCEAPWFLLDLPKQRHVRARTPMRLRVQEQESTDRPPHPLTKPSRAQALSHAASCRRSPECRALPDTPSSHPPSSLCALGGAPASVCLPARTQGPTSGATSPPASSRIARGRSGRPRTARPALLLARACCACMQVHVTTTSVTPGMLREGVFPAAAQPGTTHAMMLAMPAELALAGFGGYVRALGVSCTCSRIQPAIA